MKKNDEDNRISIFNAYNQFHIHTSCSNICVSVSLLGAVCEFDGTFRCIIFFRLFLPFGRRWNFVQTKHEQITHTKNTIEWKLWRNFFRFDVFLTIFFPFCYSNRFIFFSSLSFWVFYDRFFFRFHSHKDYMLFRMVFFFLIEWFFLLFWFFFSSNF